MTSKRRTVFGYLSILVSILGGGLQAAESRITAEIKNTRRAALTGHISPRTQSGTDQGRVEPSLVLPYVMMVLKPSATQQTELDQLLQQQQDPSSSNYHHWLTPEEYADRFGVSQADLDKLNAWLREQNLEIKSVARARNAIAVSGTAAQMEAAFGAEIHHYLVDGELHYANATNPSVPAALGEVVTGIHGLHDFRMKPHSRAMQPRYTTAGGNHVLAPDDIATLYDITPLYKAGITGKGQKIVVAGQTQINLSDIEQYRTFYSLPANDPQTMLVPGTKDPKISQADLGEADLDLELSGAVAREATILFVYSYNVMDAVQYAIDHNLAPVLSLSYGNCELQTQRSDALIYQQWAAHAATQGITWFAASGDNGAADCFGGTDPTSNNSLSVDLPAGIPEVTGVGGSEFNEGLGSYWSTFNSATQASALSYIPEMAWNDSATDGNPAASGGGASTYFTKPVWQTGTGVPNDGARDVPDVSLSGSADHDGYRIVSSGTFQAIGGTSAGPPQFSGITALLNQYLIANGVQSSDTPGVGSMNPKLYSLASTIGVFHDITQGNNIVAPCASQRNCTATPIGYNAGAGYDLVTGLGTVDVYNLVSAWHTNSTVSKGSATLKVTASTASLPFSGSTVLTASVSSANGGTPTGAIVFSEGTFLLGKAALSGSNGTAIATLTLSGIQLAAGANSITVVYAGDGSYNGASGSVNATVTSATNGPPSVKGMLNGASFTQSAAPGGVLSVFGLQLAPATGSAPAAPLPTMLAGTWVTINGIAAPLYYVSPTQLNVQVPYEVPAGAATIKVNNNGKSAFASFTVATDAPGIFTYNNGAPVPTTTAARGQEIALYITGAGAVSPAIADGAAPAAGTPLADLPAPVGALRVTVGGSTATIDFAGMPTWAVGVVQINCTIPSNAPLGAQPVVVSVGVVDSSAATLTITQ